MDAAPKVRPAALARRTSSERGAAGRYDPGMSEGDGYRLRPATVADAAVLAAQRRAMFEAMWALEAETRRYLSRAVPAGEYRAWLIEHRGAPVCGGGVQLRPLVPRAGHLD